eukprot:scaffold82398_cov58-Phaeocystis_antarctica.AAC.3
MVRARWRVALQAGVMRSSLINLSVTSVLTNDKVHRGMCSCAGKAVGGCTLAAVATATLIPKRVNTTSVRLGRARGTPGTVLCPPCSSCQQNGHSAGTVPRVTMAPERQLCALATVVLGPSSRCVRLGCRAKSADVFDWDISQRDARYGTVLRLPTAERPFCWHAMGREPWHRASIRWMSVLSDVSICKRRTRDAIQCRAEDQATRDVVWLAKGAHVHTNCGCARTCRVHAQCAAGGVRVSWTMVHH